jgi:hypothetical protein
VSPEGALAADLESVRRAALSLALAAAVATAAASSAQTAQTTCATYAYAGLVAPKAAPGIAARVTVLERPQVGWGHVAAWVGVGGPGQGPHGTDEWIQVGVSGLERDVSSLYYEVARPGGAPAYHEVRAGLAAGASHRVAVLEVAHRPGAWRVWVDGRAVSPAIRLPGSTGRWAPMAMTESWNGGRGVCNGFRYGFSGVRVAARRGGTSWLSLLHAATYERDQRIVARRRNSFVAASYTRLMSVTPSRIGTSTDSTRSSASTCSLNGCTDSDNVLSATITPSSASFGNTAS